MNNKIFAVMIVNLLGLVAFNGGAQAQADQSPVGVIAIGHSGLTGEGSDPDRPGQDAMENSWATGDAPAVNSIYQRLVAVRPATKGHVANMAVGGATSDTLASQAMAALEEVPAPELVIIQTIDNDIRCDGTDEAHLGEFGAAVAEALDVITEASPESKILIVGQRGRPTTSVPLIATIPEVVEANSGSGICDVFDVDGTLAEDRIAGLTSIIESYEAEQARVCAEVPQCATDEGAYATFVEDINSDLASDLNHLSAQGNARSAEIIWPVVDELLGL